MKKVLASLFAVFMVFGSFGVVSADEDMDCGDFASEAEAQQYWDDNGYSAENDPERLDGDGDGIPCEDDDGSSSEGTESEEGTDDSEEMASEDEDMTEEEQGGELPDTSAPYATYALFGLGLMAMGGSLFFVRKQN
ncbi:LPXTG cell wall anchor domain-containing protein [Halobacillus fulvus]|nr:LPXTG cell wall anchor domain-containing protein [Halobacillus fulvus]